MNNEGFKCFYFQLDFEPVLATIRLKPFKSYCFISPVIDMSFITSNQSIILGIPFPNKVAVHNLNLPMRKDDKIHCIDVLQALLERFLGKQSFSNIL